MSQDRIVTYPDPLAAGVETRIRDQWISDPTYAEMVQKMPIPCTDAIITLRGDDGAVYLGKRCVYPMMGIWCLGGRIFFNDQTMEESVARCVQIETGCRFEESRFRYLCTNLYSWIKTAQGDFPGKNLAPLFLLEVEQDELAAMSRGLKPAEYDPAFGLQRFNRTRLIDEQVHPAMINAFDQLFPAS